MHDLSAPLGFNLHSGGKLLALQNEFAPSIEQKKNYRSYEQILKNQKIKFSWKRLNRS